MPKPTSQHPNKAPPTHPLDKDDIAHIRAWRALVDAGCIGSRPSPVRERRQRLASQEIAVFGRVVTPELAAF